MCRSIKTLRRPEEPPSAEEVRAAALQFVRKISGYRVPSKANQAAFEAAVEEITRTSSGLLTSLSVARPATDGKGRGRAALSLRGGDAAPGTG